MYLYLVQHGEALREEVDPSRSLSEEGIEDIKKVAAFAKSMKMTAHQIFHSGKMRAFQTAQVIADTVPIDMGIAETDGLAPKDEPEIWADRIDKLNNDVILVGHLPHLARLSSLLIRGDKNQSSVNFEMGGILCLRKDDEGGWTVDWMIKPRMLK
jgi:phosphohistidine phosphatase